MTLIFGDALTTLRTLPADSVHCCITSPPYWGLRSYLPADSPNKAYEMGAEPTPDEYVARMVEVFREVRRVLRADGCCWLNLGDSYNNRRYTRPSSHQGGLGFENDSIRMGWKESAAAGMASLSVKTWGLKEKDLCLIPYRVAIALQADGWYVRSNVVWAKGVSFCEHYAGSVMPESVRDRPTSAHEAIFLLTKSERYWYDADAVREESSARTVVPMRPRDEYGTKRNSSRNDSGMTTTHGPHRNLRNVWAISPRPYHGSHYAVFPPQLVAPMLKAGCPAKVCAECGAPWVREGGTGNHHGGGFTPLSPARTVGFSPTCTHDAGTPGVVLDPFMGSGTVAQVAQDHGRRWIGIDLDPRNGELIHKRTAQQSLLGRAP